MPNNQINQVLKSVLFSRCAGSQKYLERVARVLSHSFICVLEATHDRINITKLNLDQLPTLWVALPQVSQVDERTFNHIVIKYVDLDRLDCFCTLHIDF